MTDTRQQLERARQIIAAQYEREDPARARLIRAGTSDLKAVDAICTALTEAGRAGVGDGWRKPIALAQAQFAFYAHEHRKAGKDEKAETNERFANMLGEALTAASATPVQEDGLRETLRHIVALDMPTMRLAMMPNERKMVDLARKALAATPTPPVQATPTPDVERMREALKPFAELADNFIADDADDDDNYCPPRHERQMGVRIGDLRRARAALSREPGK